MALSQLTFEKNLVEEYFKHGSINKVFSAHHYALPISFAGYTRVLSKFKVIKSAGPNSNLSESLSILSKIASYKIPLERIYHRLAPRSIQVSINTLHRILHYTRLGLTRRQGTALLITSPDYPGSFLVGNDQSLTGSYLGKRGDLSLPMAHSKLGESPQASICRVLQQEVFTNLVIDQSFPLSLIPQHPKPVMFINIADIRVSVYYLVLKKHLPFSSFKLSNIRFVDQAEIIKSNPRPGVVDILSRYQNEGLLTTSTVPVFSSSLNLSLAKVVK